MRACLGLLILTFGLLAQPAAAQRTLADVRTRGVLVCGVAGTLPGMSAPDAAGVMRGLDADFCRAIAAATLGDATRVRFESFATPLLGVQALQARRIDVLSRNTTITLSRDADAGVTSTNVLFFDGQGMMVRSESGITNFAGLDGKSVCVGTLSQQAVIRDSAAARGLRVTIVPHTGTAEAFTDFGRRGCDAISADGSALVGLRATAADGAGFSILEQLISREPLGPFVRSNDDGWRAIVTWTIALLTGAEEAGVSSTILPRMMTSTDPVVRRMLGVDPGNGTPLGLADDWGLKVLSQVGNYAEMFDRNLGAGSPLRLPRGLNALWLAGGLHYPLPLR